MRLRGGEILGILLIVVGAAFLARNAGIVTLDWPILAPVLLVVFGLAVVGSALGTGRDGRPTSVAVPRGPAELELDLAVGAGRFAVSGGAAALVEVDSREDDVRWTADRNGERGRVRIRQDPEAWGPWAWGRRRGSEWHIRLAGDVPTALEVRAGAGELELDLLPLRIVGARLDVGAATAALRLPRPVGEVRISVTLGAASLRIGVPAGVEARVAPTGALLSVDGQRETPGWARAHDRVTVTVGGGASSVRIVPA